MIFFKEKLCLCLQGIFQATPIGVITEFNPVSTYLSLVSSKSHLTVTLEITCFNQLIK